MISDKPEQAISPVGNTSSRDGCMAVGGKREMANFDDQRNLVGPCLAMEDQDEQVLESDGERDPELAGEDLGTERPRVIRNPQAPSRQEVIEHNITHCPFRSWCPECVMGKSKCDPHTTTSQDSERGVPLVAMDYAFMSDRMKDKETDEESKSQA